MKATSIVYQKVFSLGNFENEKIGIEVELNEEDNAADVLKKAKEWCEKLHGNQKPFNQAEYDQALATVNNPDDYTGKQVKEANSIIEKYKNDYVDNPSF